MNAIRRNAGFTLIEMLAVIAVTTMVLGALFLTVEYTLKVVADSRARTSALSLANDKLEYLRSLPYDDVGTVAGIPAGTIPQHSTTTLNEIVFRERVLIEYVDDPADGLLTATTTDSNGIPADYKRAKVEITWTLDGVEKSISLVSNIVPRSIETTDGGGTVRINVLGADAAPLAGASVTLINNTTTTTINVTKLSDSSGTVLFSGAPAASNYEVVVTASGYSTDQTYEATVANPNPITAPFSVLEADISTLTFQIGELSDIALTTFSDITEGRRDEWFDDVSGIASSSKVAVSGGELSLQSTLGVYDSSGVAYLSAVAPASLESWEALTVAGVAPAQTDYRVKFYTAGTSTYTLIPDADMPGNSAGFIGPIVDISSLSVATYSSVVIGVHLTTSNTAVTPTVDAVEMFYRETETPQASVAVSAHGNKVIGTDLSSAPIYKTTLSATTDAGGESSFAGVEFDTYDFSFAGGYSIARMCPTLPLVHAAGVDSDVEVVLVPAVTDSLLVTVVSDAGVLVPGSSVTLSRTGFSETVRTNTCGQAFFSSGVTAASDYQLSVSKSGFSAEVIDPYDLNGESVVTVTVSES